MQWRFITYFELEHIPLEKQTRKTHKANRWAEDTMMMMKMLCVSDQTTEWNCGRAHDAMAFYIWPFHDHYAR